MLFFPFFTQKLNIVIAQFYTDAFRKFRDNYFSNIFSSIDNSFIVFVTHVNCVYKRDIV